MTNCENLKPQKTTSCTYQVWHKTYTWTLSFVSVPAKHMVNNWTLLFVYFISFTGGHYCLLTLLGVKSGLYVEAIICLLGALAACM